MNRMRFEVNDRVRVGSGRETWHVVSIDAAAATLRSSNRDTVRTFPLHRLTHWPITDAEREQQAPRMPAAGN